MSDKIKVLVVEPMRPCQVREIPDTLEAMQQIVGGSIQAVYPFEEPVAVVCNDEGKLLGLPYNRPLFDESGTPYDILCGTFFIAGLGAEDFTSLSDEHARHFKELFDCTMVLSTPQKPPKAKSTEQKDKKGVISHER